MHLDSLRKNKVWERHFGKGENSYTAKVVHFLQDKISYMHKKSTQYFQMFLFCETRLCENRFISTLILPKGSYQNKENLPSDFGERKCYF